MRLTTTIIEVDGELVIEIPQEIIDNLGWKRGDDLVWTDLPGNVWAIEKALDLDPLNAVQYDMFSGDDDE